MDLVREAAGSEDRRESLDQVKIEQLMIYPVKSCRGISVDQSIVLNEGLEFDRRWMIVDARGVFLTQRECPEMARIVPSLDPEAFGGTKLLLRLAKPDGQLDQDSPWLGIKPSHETGLREVIVWKFEGQAVDCGHEASKFLSDFLQRPVRLVRFSESETRVCNKAWTGDLTGRTFFSDGYPILILGQASVADLAQRMKLGNLAIERFRPNIVVSGLPAYEEDFIQSLELIQKTSSAHSGPANTGTTQVMSLRLVKPCPRCPVPKVDPWTGALAHFDPAAELATFRYHEAAEGAVLGMNALAFQGQGQTITVGQRFTAICDF